MASLYSTLTNIRYYTDSDPYVYTVDNRPLTDFDTRDQTICNAIDMRTQIVDITGGGTPTTNWLPTGWSVTRNGAGDYTITHNLGLTTYIVYGSVNSSSPMIFNVYSVTNNSFSIRTYNSSFVATDARFGCEVNRWA